MMTDAPAKFQALLHAEGLVVLPACFDPFTARIAQKEGLRAVALGGYALGAQQCVTEPLLTLTQLVQAAQQMQSRLEVPVIVDAGAGFGEPMHVWHTVRELERTGVAGLHIEDQHFPKRAHYHRDYQKRVIDAGEMVDKIRAAVTSRKNPHFVICARTDAMRTDSFEEGVRRANQYAEAGADLVMIFPNSYEEATQAPKLIGAPLVYVNSHGNRVARPVLTNDELARLGYRVVIYSTALVAAAFHAASGALRSMAGRGDLDLSEADFIKLRSEIEELVGLQELYEIEERTTERRSEA